MPFDTPETTVADFCSENLYNATFAMRTLVRSEDIRALDGFQPVITALQGSPGKEAMEQVGMKIVEKFFEDENLDPTSEHGRSVAASFAPCIAEAIQTANQIVLQKMQEQHASRPQVRQNKPKIFV